MWRGSLLPLGGIAALTPAALSPLHATAHPSHQRTLSSPQGASASFNGSRAIWLALKDPKYKSSPYSRTVVIGE